MKCDSDFDVVVDYPPDMETEAAEFIEDACQRPDLASDGRPPEIEGCRSILRPHP
jgi:hypothetical protein